MPYIIGPIVTRYGLSYLDYGRRSPSFAAELFLFLCE